MEIQDRDCKPDGFTYVNQMIKSIDIILMKVLRLKVLLIYIKVLYLKREKMEAVLCIK